MKYVILFFLFFCFLGANSQLPTFNRIHPINFQSPPFDYLASGTFHDVFEINRPGVVFDGYLLFGSGILENPFNTQFYVKAYSYKVNTIGDGMWSNRFENSDDTSTTYFSAITTSSLFRNHQGIITGPYFKRKQENDGIKELRSLVQFDEDGILVSSIPYDSSFNDIRIVKGLEDFSDSSYLFIGGFIDSLGVVNQQRPDAFVIKLDTSGSVVWSKTYQDTYLTLDLVSAQNGGYSTFVNEVYNLCSSSTAYDNDVKILRLDNNGEELDRWEANYHCGGESLLLGELSNGDLLVVGKINEGFESQDSDFAGKFFSTVFSYSNGVIQESSERFYYHTDSLESSLTDLQKVTNNSGFVSVGWIWNSENAQYLGLMMKIDNSRNLLWKRTYNYFPIVENSFNGWNFIESINEASDGGFICSGRIREHAVHPNPQLIVPWVFKTDEYGCLEPGCQFVGTEDILVGLENTMTVFPNPVEDIATISFGKENLSQLSDLLSIGELIVFDIHGKEIYRTNTRSVVSEGQLQINTQSWPSGIYLAQLISGSKWMDGVKIIKG